MISRTDAPNFLESAKKLPVLDVRSPGEFRQGHIPGAFNLPLFTDEERAVVGTLYHRSGREASVLKGMELAGPRMAYYAEQSKVLAPGNELLLHCWRGGMRSENMAWLLDQAGFRVTLLDGGYKAYRSFIRSEWNRETRVIILGGMTGSGKTRILDCLEKLGEQVIDLEKIAHHKGSVFGGLGQEPQPTNEQFENNLYQSWQEFNLTGTIWMEDESRMLGNITIPVPVFEKIGRSPMILAETDPEMRIANLVAEYSGFSKEELGQAISKISEKLGGTRTQLALQDIRQGDYAAAAGRVLEYYDKAYRNAVAKRENREIYPVRADQKDPMENARRILMESRKIRNLKPVS
ncbi:MAG TPA: tRNA 2-selenouridine(34) synthase MnmH [Bacteroidales bacterium]|nr:tRNA 2-selenouridine(34) synthase MnmH [Bacteroidales bacterium]